MRQITIFLITAFISISLLNACGPSEEEKRQQELARQDSLERVRQQRLQQQRLDSIAQARQDSIAAVKKKEERRQISFNTTGDFALQVEAWRSEEKAQSRVNTWKERGFGNAYVVKYGNEDTGNIWFRIRLGRTDTKDKAQQLGNDLSEEYNTSYWISKLN